MKKLARAVFHVQELSRKLGHKLFREPVMKKALAACGENVHIAQACDIKGIENITIGDGSSIGRGAVLWTTRAEIIVGKKVMFGPNVTIITGNHRIDMVGKYMADVTDQDQGPLFNGRNRGAQGYNGSPVNRDCRGKLWMYGLA